ncbi:amidohydrolase [Nocardia sp. CNY236]|uniref:amidohydrolase family protein n=1 Tax=Nocardia sp. CNY236 TaxID=1169152 RepID=UPI000490E662|nr:amidohydrolase family protein [Nocardia sp. CNY236]
MEFSDLRIIDAHIHQWDPFTTPRQLGTISKLIRLVPVPMQVVALLVPRRDRQFAGDPSAYLRPYLPADYRADIGKAAIDVAAHVEAEWSSRGPLGKADETAWVASLPLRTAPRLGAILAGGDPAAPGFAQLLDAHAAASPLLRGIRTIAAHHPDPGVRSFTDKPGRLTTKAFLDGFAQLADRGLSFEAWVYSHSIPDVTALAERYPEVPIVLNHLGTPAGIVGAVGRHTGTHPGVRRQLLVQWRDNLAALASRPNTVAKVSGLMMPILGHPVPPRGTSTPVPHLLDRVGPLVEHALDVFGADRLIWGSNYPVDKPITSIAGSIETIARAISGHGGHRPELEQVFRAVAQRVYRIPD